MQKSSREKRPNGSGATSHDLRLTKFTASCFERADEPTERWTQTVSEATIEPSSSKTFRIAWNRFNRQADFAQQKHA
jgi:hypothetical protein